MKYKQLCPKSLRSNKSFSKLHKRCSLCDCLLKTQHYLTIGKSIHDSVIINNNKTITYAECCQRYLNDKSLSDQSHIICSKCCNNLQNLHSLHVNAEELTNKIHRTCYKTKRLNRIRQSYSINRMNREIKEEPKSLSDTNKHIETTSNIPSINSAFIPSQIFSNEFDLYRDAVHNASTVPYAQFLIDSPIATNLSHQQKQRDGSNNDKSLSPDDDRSIISCTNDEETNSKSGRLTRRQYDFLMELPDQQSLNAFIESSSSESGSRWTWRRTSSNSRGYKVYYVCNFSMRRHYHPCPAAMYALFNPEGTISVYSFGQHQHVPKNHLPLIISDETKEEIFKCLQTDMSASEIRDHLIQLKLPFGDTKKLNNFIKYHRELLRFGAVTNVRLNGTAYRQPHCWAIRRSSPINANTTTSS
ncbi:unnamed protein product [Adineta steineri]|uniref:Uncharacterized protein n=1 Tax=Adineta steineri TaxID=433720 RepID=A0A813YQH8_9BILA|nr:unnamed protein product [Adineta steineri]